VKVYLSPLAEYKLIKLTEYLEEEWGASSKIKFLDKLTQKFEQISLQPESSPITEEFESVYWSVVTRQCSLYYRIQDNEIEIITITDNRQDPEKINKEIKAVFNS
jgi:plasmid stabilization system protein ParE